MSDTPAKCLYCEEQLFAGEPLDPPGYMHLECAIRVVAGSVGHQIGLCSCPGNPGILDDPPRMTKRQAARVAALLHQGHLGPRESWMKTARIVAAREKAERN